MEKIIIVSYICKLQTKAGITRSLLKWRLSSHWIMKGRGELPGEVSTCPETLSLCVSISPLLSPVRLEAEHHGK